ncbi:MULTISPECIES: recombination mediator RecR [Halobacteriovorax]|uniref:Recombination protein RecR n=1 Tax=Halobacteriovorax vibrionivorans TaxID=2152716 RepID=A0ABY0IJJ1_9BACT|nr:MULTISPECIES: recombination mediator RecR [Halobacteriovorax]AYF43104.1 recombination protein RecR [Halobacteriovorax sp. BALOs_7]RZF23125.1 recombination protein RecR [Halobacteriovorax vibrionivorans]TGD49243.1 recombination protein RecR [Halobacteriovorax sp. Y22]
MKLPERITNLMDSFSKVPGIGEKSALRHVLSLTKWTAEELGDFSNALNDLAELKKCKQCGVFADEDICDVCSDIHRKESTEICVVESITDYMAIERSGQYRGLYHVLGGVLNPLLGVGPAELNIDKLKKRVTELGVTSIILAIGPSVEGDATCSYIKSTLPENVMVDRIGFGIPMGGNLDYLDTMTISKALENKTKM